MRKYLLLLFIAFYASGLSYAQRAPEIGVKTGLTGSKLLFDTLGNGTEIESGTMAGFYIAPFIGFAQNEGFSIYGSVGFIEHGGYYDTVLRNSSGVIIDSYRETYLYSYLIASLYGKLKVKIEEVPNFYPYMTFGPNAEFLKRSPRQLNFDHKKVRMNGTVGIGIDYDFKKISALVEYQRFFNLGSFISSRDNKIIEDQTYLFAIGLKIRIAPIKKNEKLF